MPYYALVLEGSFVAGDRTLRRGEFCHSKAFEEFQLCGGTVAPNGSCLNWWTISRNMVTKEKLKVIMTVCWYVGCRPKIPTDFWNIIFCTFLRDVNSSTTLFGSPAAESERCLRNCLRWPTRYPLLVCWLRKAVPAGKLTMKSKPFLDDLATLSYVQSGAFAWPGVGEGKRSSDHRALASNLLRIPDELLWWSVGRLLAFLLMTT